VVYYIRLLISIWHNGYSSAIDEERKRYIDRPKELRTRSVFKFRLFRWLTKSRNEYAYVLYNNDPRHKDVMRSTTLEHTDDIEKYLESLVMDIVNWNILSDIDSRFNNNAVATYLGKDLLTGDPLCIDGIVERSSVLAYSIRSLYNITKKPLYLDTYKKLLYGIDMCIINSAKEQGIRKTPMGTNIAGDEYISEEILSGIMLLVSGFDLCSKDEVVADFEFSIKVKITSIILKHDYIFNTANDTRSIRDIMPTRTYTAPKCFVYMAMQLAMGNYSIIDAGILKEVINTPTLRETLDGRMCRCGSIASANALLAIFNMYPDKDKKSITKVMNKSKFTKYAINWILDTRSVYHNSVPELDSILVIMYDYLCNIDMANNVTSSVQAVINVLYDNHIMEKSNRYRSILRSRWYDTPRTPKTRCPWCGDPVDIAPPNEDYAAFEYIICYSRIVNHLKYTNN